MAKKNEIKDLVIGLNEGKVEALRSLHTKYSTALYRACRKLFLDHEDAEEVVQDVMVSIWEHRTELRSDLSLSAYMYTIARNSALKRGRSKIMYFTIENYLRDTRIATVTNAEEEFIGNETAQIIEFLISKLPAKKQKVYIMSRIEGLSHVEIAKKMNLSIRTVENHIYQTNLFIKDKLHLDVFAPLLMIYPCCY
ncbi:RNA polymerase sigma-70 factor [Reichenbachiella sp. MALMAid0571]|uniref:RNA polymerase sigma-70 factor n=1 Tax=Reichenbachiella sp. MALMAid0571 TaxID=3143939 RepID=UPI0032E055E5